MQLKERPHGNLESPRCLWGKPGNNLLYGRTLYWLNFKSGNCFLADALQDRNLSAVPSAWLSFIRTFPSVSENTTHRFSNQGAQQGSLSSVPTHLLSTPPPSFKCFPCSPPAPTGPPKVTSRPGLAWLFPPLWLISQRVCCHPLLGPHSPPSYTSWPSADTTDNPCLVCEHVCFTQAASPGKLSAILVFPTNSRGAGTQ